MWSSCSWQTKSIGCVSLSLSVNRVPSSILRCATNNVLQADRIVQRGDGVSFARSHNMMFIEASAKSSIGVQQAFHELVQKACSCVVLFSRSRTSAYIASTDSGLARFALRERIGIRQRRPYGSAWRATGRRGGRCGCGGRLRLLTSRNHAADGVVSLACVSACVRVCVCLSVRVDECGVGCDTAAAVMPWVSLLTYLFCCAVCVRIRSHGKRDVNFRDEKKTRRKY